MGMIRKIKSTSSDWLDRKLSSNKSCSSEDEYEEPLDPRKEEPVFDDNTYASVDETFSRNSYSENSDSPSEYQELDHTYKPDPRSGYQELVNNKPKAKGTEVFLPNRIITYFWVTPANVGSAYVTGGTTKERCRLYIG